MFISDADYADAIGAPLPAPSISNLPTEISEDRKDKARNQAP